jgi:hypothetical protein
VVTQLPALYRVTRILLDEELGEADLAVEWHDVAPIEIRLEGLRWDNE